jgi:hypothetical protein
MADNIHPVIELLAARMESHPEEFPVSSRGQLPIGGRWSPWLAQAEHLMNDAERTLIYDKAKEVIFQRIHEEVLDELLNGEQRRAEEKAAHDAEVQRLLGRAQAQAQINAQRGYANQAGAYQNAIGPGTAIPSQKLVTGTTWNETMRITPNGELKLGNETLNEGMLKQIRRKLGL